MASGGAGGGGGGGYTHEDKPISTAAASALGATMDFINGLHRYSWSGRHSRNAQREK